MCFESTFYTSIFPRIVTFFILQFFSAQGTLLTPWIYSDQLKSMFTLHILILLHSLLWKFLIHVSAHRYIFFVIFFTLLGSSFDSWHSWIWGDRLKSISWHSLLWKSFLIAFSLFHLSAHCNIFLLWKSFLITFRSSICPRMHFSGACSNLRFPTGNLFALCTLSCLTYLLLHIKYQILNIIHKISNIRYQIFAVCVLSSLNNLLLRINLKI